MGESDEIARLRARVAELEARAEIDQLICAQLPVIVWTTDRDLRFTWSCGAAGEALPLSHDQVVGTTLFEYFQTTDRDFLPIANSLRALEGDVVRHENEWLGRRYIVTISPLRSAAGDITGTLGVALDVTDQKIAESALRASEMRYRELFEHATDIVYTHDLSGRFMEMNRAAERVLGYDREALLRLSIDDLTVAEQRDLPMQVVRLLLRRQGPPSYEVQLQTRSGDRITVDVSTSLIHDNNGIPVAVQGVARDVTHRKRMEEQVRQSQKMEAIGVLAGGVAHDFNNLLTGILGNAYLLKGRLRDGSSSAEAVNGIIESAERASQLTQQLLGFARQGKNQSTTVDVHEVIRSVVSLLMRTIDKRIHIVTAFEAGRAVILGDANQIYQMFLNLGLNARDAMHGGGELRFATETRGGELLITVSDTGSGIPEAIRHRIFEPFFTTKEPDKGTGLGLAMVYGIIQNHGGTVHVESGNRGGTSFHLSFPLSEKAAPAVAVRKKEQVIAASGRILVIDDEPVVRRVLSRMLQELGFEVLRATDSVDAIEYFQTHAELVDLVILDLVMPKLGGKECLQRLREINPGVKAVLSSGYGREGAVQEILDSGLVVFLQKPYTLNSLAEVVRAALEMKTASSV